VDNFGSPFTTLSPISVAIASPPNAPADLALLTSYSFNWTGSGYSIYITGYAPGGTFLQGYFFSRADVHQEYHLNVSVAGSQLSNSPYAFVLSPLPAPRSQQKQHIQLTDRSITQVVFSTSGAALHVNFDGATNRAQGASCFLMNVATKSNCPRPLLRGYQCSWQDFWGWVHVFLAQRHRDCLHVRTRFESKVHQKSD
jgi:hypothetical protein